MGLEQIGHESCLDKQFQQPATCLHGIIIEFLS